MKNFALSIIFITFAMCSCDEEYVVSLPHVVSLPKDIKFVTTSSYCDSMVTVTDTTAKESFEIRYDRSLFYPFSYEDLQHLYFEHPVFTWRWCFTCNKYKSNNNY